MAIVLRTAVPALCWYSEPLLSVLLSSDSSTPPSNSIPSCLELLVLPCAVPSSPHVSLGSSSTVGH